MATHLFNIVRAKGVGIIMMSASLAASGQTSTSPLPSHANQSATATSLDIPTVNTADSARGPFNSTSAPLIGAKDDTLQTSGDSLHLPQSPLLITKTDSRMLRAKREHKIFMPNPQRALWLSFVIPGGGQIYNRKYWKLPIFYGGFLGCMYAFNWNQQMYMDYSQAYLDIMDDNPDTNSYLSMFPPTYDIEANASRYQAIFKNRKDRFRRWRDLSAFCFIAVYGLSIIDAYVDAHLSVFDISPDLSLQWGPTSVAGPTPNIGLGATLNF